jgi:protein-S-isoprenylcysteine O-methyltransferase Ste14
MTKGSKKGGGPQQTVHKNSVVAAIQVVVDALARNPISTIPALIIFLLGIIAWRLPGERYPDLTNLLNSQWLSWWFALIVFVSWIITIIVVVLQKRTYDTRIAQATNDLKECQARNAKMNDRPTSANKE